MNAYHKEQKEGLEESGYLSKTEALEDLGKAVRLRLIPVITSIKIEELIQKDLEIPAAILRKMEKAKNSSL